MPIVYKVESNTNLSTAVNMECLKIATYVALGIVAIALIYLCIKYKANGILLGISYVGYIALLLIILRYTNVIISLEAIAGIVVLLIANYMFIKYTLNKISNKNINKKEALKQTYIRYTSILLPLLLIAIVFTFMKWIPIASIGMVMFWGLVTMFVYNYIAINLLLDNK